MSVPTTTFGSWVNIQPTGSGTTPASYVTDAFAEFIVDYNSEAVVAEFMAAVQDQLPPGLWLLGNGELIGDAYGPRRDAITPDPIDLVRGIIAEVDVFEIGARHDLTERAAAFLVYPIGEDGQRSGDPIDRGAIDSPETAHQLLRDLDEDLSAEDFGAEPGSQWDAVIVDGEDNELRSVRVYAR